MEQAPSLRAGEAGLWFIGSDWISSEHGHRLKTGIWDETLLGFVPDTGAKEVACIRYLASHAYPTGD